ncbi:MAG: glycosyltransferase family 2 protein [Cyclobacteriaceae bacterium]|nr:glycosyltransferase family 2 protein [Cyclobacteriaceae bacterium]
MPHGKTLISVVIPVKNGAETLDACLYGIASQKVGADIEVIVIDSGSTDNSLDIIRKYPKPKIISIDPASFNHGLTRNLGVAHANGDFVVMTVQDAVPADEHWLAKMLRHFDDPNVAGVCGQQVVPHHKDKNPHLWFRPMSQPSIRKVHFNTQEEYDLLLSEEKKQACSWDDVNSMYRREALLKMPFREAFLQKMPCGRRMH